LKGYNMAGKSKSYFVALQDLNTFSTDDVVFPDNASGGGRDSAQYSVTYYMTLYNKDIGFYGRTFVSRKKQLQPAQGQRSGNLYEHTREEEFVYFHSSF